MPQIVKIPHFRNLYSRVGMFGMPNVRSHRPGNNRHRGNQIRGYGFLHDGSVDTLFRLHTSRAFDLTSNGQVGFRNDRERRDIVQFLPAFDSDLASVVGQQVTVGANAGPAALARVQLLMERAATPFDVLMLGGRVTECDLVVRLFADGRQMGLLFDPDSGLFQPDTSDLAPMDLGGVRALAASGGLPATFTCVPPGSGVRTALDRDRDTVMDGDEIAAGTDPADPTDRPDP